ncbi:MAG: betaine/proline/choline family ABC transporter ATP-binding protein [Calditrichae bacterium]|nr:betaine/proline/choline family ABC transporter ATP-binding protein [Calditrichia bacterium]
MSVIEVKNLYKIFGHNPERAFPLIEKGMSKEEILEKTGCVVAINNATFAIEKKETFVIMGLSGSGKSTVIRCLNRLIEPTRGQILIDGDDIMQMDKEQLLKARRSKMSMVFQHFGLLPHRSVVNNVEYGLEISGIDKETRRKKALEAIELVGLKGFENSMPDELSGGMQQRVGLARALANNPEVLLMDEAFSALDPLIRTQMQDELIELQAKMHKTIVFITHDLDEALKMGDRIAIMGQGGGVIQIGTSEEILTNPADDYVRAFVQNVDRTKVITTSRLMRKAPTITVPKDGPMVASRRMEQVGVSTLYVVDNDRNFKGIVKVDDVIDLQKKKQNAIDSVLITDDVYISHPETPIADLLNTAIATKYPIAVVDDDGKLLGIVDRASIMAEVSADTEDTTSPITLKEAMDGEASDGTKKEVATSAKK